MTKGELIEFLKPFTDDLRIALPDGDNDDILRDAEPRYIMVDGEGIVVFDQGACL